MLFINKDLILFRDKDRNNIIVNQIYSKEHYITLFHSFIHYNINNNDIITKIRVHNSFPRRQVSCCPSPIDIRLRLLGFSFKNCM